MIIQRILEVSSFCSQTEGMPCARISSFSLPHTWDESKYSSPLLPSLQRCAFTPEQNNKHTFVGSTSHTLAQKASADTFH